MTKTSEAVLSRRAVLAAGASVPARLDPVAARRRCRFHPEIRDRPGSLASRQQAGRRSHRPHQGSHRRARRDQPVSGQPARLRHRLARPDSQRRRRLSEHRVLGSRNACPGRRHRQHRFRFCLLRRGLEGDGRRSRKIRQGRNRERRRASDRQVLGQRVPPADVVDARDQDA